MSNFKDLGVSPLILKALEDMGFESPTEVQEKAIPHILNKEDLIVLSKTGSGKTAVFGVPMLQMASAEGPGPKGLILTPTRELAVQVDGDIKKMSKYLSHKTTAVYGQHSANVEVQALNKGVSIVTGTPGRVYDHISRGNLNTKNIGFLVLDEADRMLDMGFLDQVLRIIKTLPKERITLLFSATFPDEIHSICRQYMKDPVTVEIESQTKTVDAIDQSYFRTKSNEKFKQLYRFLLFEQPESCMIFCNTKYAVDRVQRFLYQKGLSSKALHGDIPQGKRMQTIQQFKNGDFRLLVATDVAARGIHIDSLSLVINYDVPVDKDSYVHRIGRTGRAGQKGRAITFVTGDDIMDLYAIEEHIGALVPEAEMPSEEELQARKEQSEQWVQANALKTSPSRPAREPGSDDMRKKRQSKKPYQKYGTDDRGTAKDGQARERPAKERTNKSRKPEEGYGYRNSSRPASAQNQTKGKPVQERSQAAAKPRPSNTPEIKGLNEIKGASSAPSKSQPVETKLPFLKRLFQKLFGK